MNIALVRVNQESCMVPIDNGCQVNTVMPQFIEAHSLDVGPVSNLVNDGMSMVGLGRMHPHPHPLSIVISH